MTTTSRFQILAKANSGVSAKFKDVKMVVFDNPVVEIRCKKLKIRCISGVEDKAKALRALCAENKIDLQSTCFLGNDRNDIPALNLVGLPAVVADADVSLNKFDYFRTSTRGGFGAVREICEAIFAVTENLAK